MNVGEGKRVLAAILTASKFPSKSERGSVSRGDTTRRKRGTLTSVACKRLRACHPLRRRLHATAAKIPHGFDDDEQLGGGPLNRDVRPFRRRGAMHCPGMTSKIIFHILSLSAIALSSAQAWPQATVPRIGFLSATTPDSPAMSQQIAGFRHGLRIKVTWREPTLPLNIDLLANDSIDCRILPGSSSICASTCW